MKSCLIWVYRICCDIRLVYSLLYNNCLGLQNAHRYREQSGFGLQYVLHDGKRSDLDFQYVHQYEEQSSLGL